MSVNTGHKQEARRGRPRRAFSLLELLVVIAIIGLLAGSAAMRFGHDTLNTTDTEGFVRRLVLDLRLARRATIATGDDHFVRFNRTGGNVASYDLIRAASGGDTPVQPTTLMPDGTAVTTPADDWRYDFTGGLTTGGATSTIQIDGARFVWTVTLYQATGAVRSSKAAQP